MRIKSHLFITLLLMLTSALFLKFGLGPILHSAISVPAKLTLALIILLFGAAYPLTKAAQIIETTTDVLSKKTNLAAGLLQSLGTAFPDMILGVTAAIISLSLIQDDPTRAISFAIIAASTTFGSNIYNIGHAAWCIYRQNRADRMGHDLPMFPRLPRFGLVRPLSTHTHLPHLNELDKSIRILTILSLLTAGVALTMVAFGAITPTLYQLIRPAGLILLLAASFILYLFRQKSGHVEEAEAAVKHNSLLAASPLATIWFALLIAGITIAFSAETMVKALEVASELLHIPYVISGTMAGLIGCLGEMLVIHNYSIHQNGRLGDAVVGVAMDNIVTIMGAAIVSVLGGIFLGGTSLIILFVVILTLNTVLIDQINILKTTLLKTITSAPMAS